MFPLVRATEPFSIACELFLNLTRHARNRKRAKGGRGQIGVILSRAGGSGPTDCTTNVGAVDLCARLGYQPSPPNPLQRVVQRVAATRPGAWLFSKTARYVDRVALRLTKGRSTAAGWMAGLPVITLTTTGAKSGLQRTSALLGVPDTGNLGLLGTNFGQASTPAWFHNLDAHPDASVEYRGMVVPVRAHEAEGDERERIVTAARSLYLGFAAYEQRIDGRPIHVMVLEAT